LYRLIKAIESFMICNFFFKSLSGKFTCEHTMIVNLIKMK
jgi:hypothetical protein